MWCWKGKNCINVRGCEQGKGDNERRETDNKAERESD